MPKVSKFHLLDPGFNTVKLSKWYLLSDFQDPLTGTVRIFLPLVDILSLISDRLGTRVNVTSGFRTPEHNASLPGAHVNSAHLYGLAVDIGRGKYSLEHVAKIAREFGVTTVLLEDTHLHLAFNQIPNDLPR